MTNKTVDVILSMDGEFPIVLEVVDTENIEYSKERQEYFKKVYENVNKKRKILF